MSERLPIHPELDAVVVGAGLAGCAASIVLRECGLRVAVLERERQPRSNVGEHLRPEALAELDALQVPAEGRASYLRESAGIRVAWGSAELRERDYLFDLQGAGHNVLRQELESALARRAAEAGAIVQWGVSQLRIHREPDGTWCVDGSVEGEPRRVRARWLLDATGRRASVARRLGARREHVDRSVAFVGRLSSTGSIDGAERLLVESAPDGWWYSLALPDGCLTAVYLTDSDVLPDRDASRIWSAAIEETEHTRLRVRGARLEGPISVHAAQSAILTPISGSGWVAIGDAAWSSDPLAGIGISEALQSARSAARAVDAACSGDGGPLLAHVAATGERIDAKLAQLLDAYRQELRWADRRFWSRRHAAPARIAPITLRPEDLVRFSPSAWQQRPALGIAPEHVTTLLALAPTPRPAASVMQEFTRRCPVGATSALRALQALAEVVESQN